MRSVIRVALAVFAIAMLAGVGWLVFVMRHIPDPATRQMTLKSGRSVEVIWAGVLKESKPAWVFKYRTRISIRDEQGLRREVEALWPEIQEQAERTGVAIVSLRPTNFATRLRLFEGKPRIVTQEGRAFGFERNSDGVWKKQSGWLLEHQR